MTEQEKLRYHQNYMNTSDSEAYFDNQYLNHLKNQLDHNGKLSDNQIQSLYNIFMKSFKSEIYTKQEIEAFLKGKRINKAECE